MKFFSRKEKLGIIVLLLLASVSAIIFLGRAVKTPPVPNGKDAHIVSRPDPLPPAAAIDATPVVGRKNNQAASDAFLKGRDSTRSIPPSDAPIKPMLEGMKARALEGDNDAALQLYVDLQTCRDVLRRGEDFIKTNGQGLPEDIRESTRKTIEKQLDNCKGISAEDTRGILQWIELAARRGDPQAKIMWISSYIEEKGGGPWMIQHPEDVVEYKKKSMDYLNELADKCSTTAVSMLFWEYYSVGILTEKNDSSAYLYAAIYNHIEPGVIRGEEVAEISSRLNAGQIESLNASARKFYQSHCL